MKDNEEKLMENQAEKESCKELSDEKLSEDVLEDVSAGTIDSGAKYINIRLSMKTEIYGNVRELLKKKDEQFVDQAELKCSLFLDAESDLGAPPESIIDRPRQR
ncbi:MAG: hypothetical protein K6F31_09505 [Acetatifactor sp.]|nr:hypothetical protein [Acetatifactor sp.]